VVDGVLPDPGLRDPGAAPPFTPVFDVLRPGGDGDLCAVEHDAVLLKDQGSEGRMHSAVPDECVVADSKLAPGGRPCHSLPLHDRWHRGQGSLHRPGIQGAG